MGAFGDIGKYGNRTALRSENGSLTYSELTQAADSIAEKLPPRSLVMVLCRNDPAAVAGYIGFLRNEIVPIMVNHAVDRALLDKIYASYRPNAVYAPTDEWNDGTAVFTYGGYTLFKTDHESLYPMNGELALLLTTSGSTGSPKLVRQSYKNIESNTRSIIGYLGIDKTERAITTLPINYTYGLSVVQTHLAAGAEVFCTEKTFFDRDIWKIFDEYGITSFGAVPYTFEMLKRLRFLNMELPHLRYITQAGGKLSRELQLEFAQAMRKKGKKFIVMYGATEATARMAYLPAGVSVEKAGSVGVPIPGGRFEIVGDDGKVVTEAGQAGELVYYGDNVTPGYAESADDLALPDERHGRLETGDIALCDEDGYYYIIGRRSRFLKMFGNRVNLMEVEKLLSDNGWETACAGEDNDMQIFTTSPDTDEIRRFVSEKLRLHVSAIKAFHIDSIPRSESGKVLYSRLKKD